MLDETNVVKDVSLTENRKLAFSNQIVNETWVKVNILQTRVFFVLAAQIRKEDEDLKTYKIYVKDLIEFIGLKSNKRLYSQMKEIADDITSIKVKREEDNQFVFINVFLEAGYKEGDAYLKVSLNPRLKDDFLQLKKNFTTAALKDVVRLKTYYAQRIYFLVRQFINTPEQTRIIKLDDLKRILNVEDKYPEYRDFKKRILVPSQKDIAKMGLVFEIEEVRKNRKVSLLKFVVVEDAQLDENEETDIIKGKSLSDEKTERLKERLKELKLSSWQINRILKIPNAKDETEVWKLINEIKMAWKDGRVKGELGGYTAKKFDNKFSLGFWEKTI